MPSSPSPSRASRVGRPVLPRGPGRRLDRLRRARSASIPQRARWSSGGIEAQVRQALANVEAVLGDCGCGWEHVAKTTLFVGVESPQWMSEVNAIYAEVLGEHRPARSTVGVTWLPAGAVFEIEVWAYKPERP